MLHVVKSKIFNQMKKAFIRNFRKILRRFERELYFQNVSSCCNGVTLAQCHTLLEIDGKEKISVSELAINLSLDKSTVSRTIEGLVKKGFIDRKIPSENRRTTQLQLTEEGAKTCENINWNNDGFISEALKNLDEEEQLQFLRLFEKITANMVESRDQNKAC